MVPWAPLGSLSSRGFLGSTSSLGFPSSCGSLGSTSSPVRVPMVPLVPLVPWFVGFNWFPGFHKVFVDFTFLWLFEMFLMCGVSVARIADSILTATGRHTIAMYIH